MNLGRPERSATLDALAAEYALGTLSSRVRRRLARAAISDPVVAQAIASWENRLARLADAIPGVTPPPRVWTGIEKRLGLGGTELSTRADAGRWWTSVSLWRGLTLASFTLALV